MEDREFLDHIYQVWSKTTGAKNRYWMYEPDEEAPMLNNIYAVGEDDSRKRVASAVTDEDADFITGVHGAFADLVRRLHTALDEGDRLDEEKDNLIGRVAELEQQVDRLTGELSVKEDRIRDLEEQVAEANSYVEGLGAENTRLERELAERG